MFCEKVLILHCGLFLFESIYDPLLVQVWFFILVCEQCLVTEKMQ